MKDNQASQRTYYIIRLKNTLKHLYSKGRISENEYLKEIEKLDVLLEEMAPFVLRRDFSDYLKQVKENVPDLSLDFFQNLAGPDPIDSILIRREKAEELSQGEIDLQDLYSELTLTPIKGFSWKHFSDRFHVILDSLKGYPHQEFSEKVYEIISELFNPFGLVTVYQGIPNPKPAHLRNVIEGSTQEKNLLEDWKNLQAKMVDQQSHFRKQFLAKENFKYDISLFGDIAFNMMRYCILYDNSEDIKWVDERLALWQGPRWAELLELRNATGNYSPCLSAVIAAKTGIHPGKDGRVLQHWAKAQIRKEKNELEDMTRLIEENSERYCLSWMLFFSGGKDEFAKERWGDCLKVYSLRQIETQRKQIEILHTEEIYEEKKFEFKIDSSVEPVISEEVLEMAEFPESLEAGKKEYSPEEKKILEESTWNKYLKPFLVENWLGLLGVSSLLIAWIFLAMWFWDRGQIVRLLMGGVPLAGATLGAGWLAGYMEKYQKQGASPKAIQLFALLGFFLIPFNFSLAFSLVSVKEIISSNLIYGIVGIIYSACCILISGFVCRKSEKGLGFQPFRFVLNLSLVFLISTILISIFPFYQSLFIDACAITAVFIFLKYISLFTEKNPESIMLVWLLLGGITILFSGIYLIFFKTLISPQVASFAVMGLAWGVMSFTGYRTGSYIGGGALEALAVSLSIWSPWAGLGIVLLGSLFWDQIGLRVKEVWPKELAVFHLFSVACILFICVEKMGISLIFFPLFVISGLLICEIYESRRKGNLLSLTILWYLSLLGCIGCTSGNLFSNLIFFVCFGIIGLGSLRRMLKTRNSVLYLITPATFIGILGWFLNKEWNEYILTACLICIMGYAILNFLLRIKGEFPSKTLQASTGFCLGASVLFFCFLSWWSQPLILLNHRIALFIGILFILGIFWRLSLVSCSGLPLYFMVVFSLVNLKLALSDIPLFSGSGLSMGIGALFFACLVKKLMVYEKTLDYEFPEFKFPMSGAEFLILPFVHFFWISFVAGCIRAATFPRLSLSYWVFIFFLMLSSVLMGMIRKNPVYIWISQLPFLFSIGLIIEMLQLKWICIVPLLLIAHWNTGAFLLLKKDRQSRKSGKLWMQFQKGYFWIFLIVSMGMYFQERFYTSLIFGILFSLFTLFYLHLFIRKRKFYKTVYLGIPHLFLLIGYPVYRFTQSLGLRNPHLSAFLGVIFLLQFLVLIYEKKSLIFYSFKPYIKGFQDWMFPITFFLTIGCMLKQPPLVFLIVSYILIEFSERYYHKGILRIGGICILMRAGWIIAEKWDGFSGSVSVLVLYTLGMFLFSKILFQTGIYHSNIITSERNPEKGMWNGIMGSTILLWIFHGLQSGTYNLNFSFPLWIYGISLVFFLLNHWKPSNLNFYLCFFSIAYSNVLLSLRYSDFGKAYYLTPLHFVSLGLGITVIGIWVVLYFQKRRG